jgi:hypothetical protein
MRQLLEMQMKMQSRVETSMVRLLILKALMGSLHMALGLYKMVQRFEKRLFRLLIIVWVQAAAQQFSLPVPEGCPDPSAENFDPTVRSDVGSCLYQF